MISGMHSLTKPNLVLLKIYTSFFTLFQFLEVPLRVGKGSLEERLDLFISTCLQRAIVLRSILEKFKFVSPEKDLDLSRIQLDALRVLLFDHNFAFGSRSIETVLTVSLSASKRVRLSDLALHKGGASFSPRGKYFI